MPWTFAHPAAAILVRRVGGASLPLSGLVVGSLSPDFGYYVGAFSLATHAHTLPGTLTICVPSACLLVVLLSRLRPLLVAPLPQPHRAAIESLPSLQLWPCGCAVRMLLAVWLGALTHVAWDSFTHASGLMVLILAPLRAVLFEYSGRTFATYSILQHAGTVFGIAVIGMAYCRWLQRTVGIRACLRFPVLRDSLPLVMAGVLSAALGFVIALLRLRTDAGWPVLMFRGVVDSTIVFSAVYLVLALHAVRKARLRAA